VGGASDVPDCVTRSVRKNFPWLGSERMLKGVEEETSTRRKQPKSG
jgi:hypothetical protein